ncbi:NAD(P)H-hydrate epimerase [Candidatus Acetothermia bacterium]|nr:NAD(P)H-hydrate epimerase [Candidatus Acetothermia bacterium]
MTLDSLSIPALTAEQMREVDRLMVEDYGIQLLQMMENAGRNLAELARRWLGGSVSEKHLVVAIGKGNNGGGGMTAARHLSNWGAKVTVLSESEAFSGVPHIQWKTLKRLPIEKKLSETAIEFLAKRQGDLFIDSLIGYSLSGPPRGWVARLIETINAQNIPVIALDIPSGLNPTTGAVYQPCIRATATMTLALPKVGLIQPRVKDVVGTLYLADIGVPDALYKQLGINVGSIFVHDTIIPLT